jgi:hypothetical protein
VLVVFVCWRGLAVLVPVPAVAADRVNEITPRSLVNVSIGSARLNGMLAGVAVGPLLSRRPKVWSRNWPQVQPHWVTRRSENTFWLTSLMMRLLT